MSPLAVGLSITIMINKIPAYFKTCYFHSDHSVDTTWEVAFYDKHKMMIKVLSQLNIITNDRVLKVYKDP
jgi:hypothetical protein